MKINRILKVAGALAVLAAPDLAFAQMSGGIVEATLQKIIDFLTGTPARLIGIIMIVTIGYQCYKGRIDWERAVAVSVGIMVIYSSAAIMNLLSGQ